MKNVTIAVAVVVAAVAFLGAPDAGDEAFVCEYNPRVQVGTVAADQGPMLAEASGLAQSRRVPDVLWSHQDNADDERLFAIRRDGTYLGTWDLDVGPAIDPEDLAIGPGPVTMPDAPDPQYLFLGDIGSNDGLWGCTEPSSDTGSCSGCPTGLSCEQRDLHVWRALEPIVDPNQAFTAVASYPADTITLRFPDAQMLGRQQNAETLMVDPLTGDIYVATSSTTPGMVFRAPFPQSTTVPIVMEWVADLPFGGSDQATSGDISPDGRLIIIRRESDVFIWERPAGTTVGDALAGTFCQITGLSEPEGQAVAFDVMNEGTFYTLSEADGQPSVPIYLHANVNAACIADVECQDGLFCNGDESCGFAGVCEPGTSPACGSQVCSEAMDACVDCLSDLDCAFDETCDAASGTCAPASPLPLVATETWRYLEGIAEPPSGWAGLAYDDSDWSRGPGGFGYGDDCAALHGTTFPAMAGSHSSLYLRIPFLVEDPSAIETLTLNVDYDDGFVAYLNGTEVARSNVAGVPPAFDATATVPRECSGGSPPQAAEDFDLDPTELVAGRNVLAVQAHNDLLASDDFSWIAGLSATLVGACTVDADCIDDLYCNGEETCVDGFCAEGDTVTCDDSVGCTEDTCNEDTDSCDFTPENDTCDDGAYCNGAETCDPTLDCQPGDPVVCDDGVACTTDACNEDTDSCDATPQDTACDDGMYCNGAETCDPTLDCQPGTPVVCDDDVACTTDACNEDTDSCDATPQDTACDDGMYCNGAETCDPILDCRPGVPVVCDDGVACTADACNEDTDSCDATPQDTACDDGMYCNGAETCDPTLDCQPGAPVACDDGIECTLDSCNEDTDSCDAAPQDTACDDGTYCNGAEVCTPGVGCEAGPAVACDDGIACTLDACNEDTDSCDATPQDTACDDGMYCNGAETCDPTLDCRPGDPVVCDDGVECTLDTCNESTDTCEATPEAATCDDGLFCNGVEICDGENGCLPGTPVVCDDGIACTTDFCNEDTDSCDIVADDDVCDDGLFCNGAESCNPASGCEPGQAVACDDGIDCTLDTCNEDTDSCEVATDDLACDDGLFCNGVESCSATLGCQAGAPIVCNDRVGCTVDTCDEDADACTSEPDDAACDNGVYCDGLETCHPGAGCQAPLVTPCPGSCNESLDNCGFCTSDADCDDGVFCNGPETCVAGGCQPTLVPFCDDGIDCTVDICLEIFATCVNAPDGATCDDGLFCNGMETCDASVGCVTTDPPCPAPECDEDIDECLGCDFDADCDDGLYCNGLETCDGGLCAAGTPIDCDDGVECTADTCDEDADACTNPPSDAACDDGLFCNGAETCDIAAGCLPGAVPCADCNETADFCVGDGSIWMAFSNNVSVPGIEETVRDEDIVSYNPTTGLWAILFDGSDVGIGNKKISALAVLPDGDLLLSFTARVSVDGLDADDSDVLRFTPTSLGPDTAGTFSMYFDGSDIGLTKGPEDIDALAMTADGRLILSTTGSFEANGVEGEDEDLFVFDHTSLGPNTAGALSLFVDGSDIGLTSNQEDIDAATVTAAGDVLFSTFGKIAIGTTTGDDEDIAELDVIMTGPNTAGSVSILYDLTTLGISKSEDVVALYIND